MSGYTDSTEPNAWDMMWEDQANFNLELRPDPATMSEDEKSQLTSDLSLHLINEVGELLRHVKWKKNRRNKLTANPVMVREELIDILKLWMSLAQVWEPDINPLILAYWEKSAVVRRRHAEEFIRDSKRDSAIIDLDGVMADFIGGAIQWLRDRNFSWKGYKDNELPQMAWRAAKHEFYLSGGFRTLPLMPGAKEFVDWCRSKDWNVVFLTSRGIDRYPNILTDTLWWMEHHQLHADFVWWGGDKPAKLEQEEVLEHVKLAVDDDEQFINQYKWANVSHVAWLRPEMTKGSFNQWPGYWEVKSLALIMEHYDGLQ